MISDNLQQRAKKSCELCNKSGIENLEIYTSPGEDELSLAICSICSGELETFDSPAYWHCLSESMWSEVSAVKIVVWRLLDKLKVEAWASDLLGQIYLTDDELKTAKLEIEPDRSSKPKDSNGQVLDAGDSVTLIKDLVVKGANFTAKRGTLVKNITLTGDNETIEGRLNGSQIVLKTCFLKKA